MFKQSKPCEGWFNSESTLSMGQDQSQVFLAPSCRVETPPRVIICGGFRALGVTEWEGGAEGALKRKARQSHSRLMLSESERSCHVFWQLTRLVWILQHKAGTVVWVFVCVFICVNVCFCAFARKCAPGLFFSLTLLPSTVTSLPHKLLPLTL